MLMHTRSIIVHRSVLHSAISSLNWTTRDYNNDDSKDDCQEPNAIDAVLSWILHLLLFLLVIRIILFTCLHIPYILVIPYIIITPLIITPSLSSPASSTIRVRVQIMFLP